MPQLRWLGADYLAMLANDLAAGLRRQDPGTVVLGVLCERVPELAAAADPAGIVRSHDATFSLQVFLSDSLGRPWRLRGRWTYAGRDLGTPAATITYHWELHAADGV